MWSFLAKAARGAPISDKHRGHLMSLLIDPGWPSSPMWRHKRLLKGNEEVSHQHKRPARRGQRNRARGMRRRVSWVMAFCGRRLRNCLPSSTAVPRLEYFVQPVCPKTTAFTRFDLAQGTLLYLWYCCRWNGIMVVFYNSDALASS